MNDRADTLVAVIRAAREGDAQASSRLTRTIYDDLRALAVSMMNSQPAGHTLQPTALVHEAYLKVDGFIDRLEVADRAHLFRTIAQAMRQVLIDSARRKATDKHGGGRHREDEAVIERQVIESGSGADPEIYVRLSNLVEQLAEEDPRSAEVVRLKVFGGCTIDQIAEVLGVSVRTVHREYDYAKRWLATNMAA